jgi:uncharacterized phage-associated protein
MTYDVLDVADEFLNLARRDKSPVDPLKLQKLVYLGHGWNLALRSIPLILNDVEAWKWGPVVPKLYHRFRDFRANPITTPPRSDSPVDDKSRAMIESAWKVYKPFSSIQLSMLTHESGSAWDIIRRAAANDWTSPVIPNELIKEEFLIRRSNDGNLRQTT